MKSVEESVVTAMDGSDIGLFPFLPYIVQDVWEIGSSPEVIIELVRKYTNNYTSLHILDLGCGKGAVSIRLAGQFHCSCLGIDAVEEFIHTANKKAREHGVARLCKFEIADIRNKVKELTRFDVIILGSIGPVFGNYYTTLTTLTPCLKRNGIIIIDDGYIDNNSNYTHPFILKREDVLQQIRDSGMEVIAESIGGKTDIKDADEYIFARVKKRCLELMEMHPGKRRLFEAYIKKQEEENDVLETKIICSAMVIKKRETMSY